MSEKMKTIIATIGIAVVGATLSACSLFSGSDRTYCLEEKEANGLDYMTVADMSVCENANSDAEYYDTSETLFMGDIVYVEVDGHHSVKHPRKSEGIKSIPNPPPFTTQAPRPAAAPPTKICLKAYRPPPPAPPKPAPVPAPKPPAVAPKPQPAPVIPKAPVNNPTQAPTVKPGC